MPQTSPRLALRALARAMSSAFILALLAGCSEPQGLSPLAPDAVILAFGDSITHGTGAREGEAYPQVLAELTGRAVVASGVPGELSQRGLSRLPGVLERIGPALVILCHGGNDILRRHPAERTADNLRAMVRKIRERGAEVVMIGVPRFGLVLDTAPLYEAVAEELAVPLEASALPSILSDSDLKADAVHPNAAGYRRLAEAVRDLLRARGAL